MASDSSAADAAPGSGTAAACAVSVAGGIVGSDWP
jgi:hypothetical protein